MGGAASSPPAGAGAGGAPGAALRSTRSSHGIPAPSARSRSPPPPAGRTLRRGGAAGQHTQDRRGPVRLRAKPLAHPSLHQEGTLGGRAGPAPAHRGARPGTSERRSRSGSRRRRNHDPSRISSPDQDRVEHTGGRDGRGRVLLAAPGSGSDPVNGRRVDADSRYPADAGGAQGKPGLRDPRRRTTTRTDKRAAALFPGACRHRGGAVRARPTNGGSSPSVLHRGA